MSVNIDFEKLKELCDNGKAAVTTYRDSLTNETCISIATACDPFIEIRKEKKENIPSLIWERIRKEKEKMPPVSWESHPIGTVNYRSMFSESLCRTNENKIKRVIFSNPMTIIIWEDGKKTYARTTEDDEYDPFRGFLLCYAKKKLRKEVTQYKDFLFNIDSKGRYFIEHLIKGMHKDWKTYEKEVLNLYFEYIEKK